MPHFPEKLQRENGALSDSTVVKVTFKNSKTKKTTTKKYRCVVKEEKKPVEEAYKINSASATGVKTITVELNKAVTDATKITKVDVKKGTAARESKFAVDGSKIVITMDAKLTAGAYSVTVEGLEAAALTADVTVEKDETLTSFEVSDYIVAKSTTETTAGSIKFAALNQYGEKMVSSDPTVTCSFGTVTNNQKPSKSATATAEGEITVENISPMLAIVGTKGTVVLVGEMGVTVTKEISYNVAATPATAEVAGTYHINSATIKTITEKDKISDYELLLTVKDQYGYAVDTTLFERDKVNVTIAGGLTNIAVDTTKGLKNRTVNGVDYIAISLKGLNGTEAIAGDATLSIVNPYKGMLLTTTISVAKNVIIKSLNITAPNGVYAGQKNELSYEIIDAEGKSVTSYAVLSSGILTLPTDPSGPVIRLEKNADGTAKMIYTPKANPSQPGVTDKASQPEAVTVMANSQIGGDYLVKTFSFTVYQARYAKSVSGIAADQVTSISSKGQPLKIESSKLVLADQYSNKIVSTDSMFNDKIFDTTTGAATGTAIYVAENDAVKVTINTADKNIIAKPVAVGTATVYLKYCYDETKPATASPTSYDARFTISVYDTAGVDVSTLEIKSVNDGFTVSAADAASLSKDKIKVVAKIGGTETVIPSEQYEIVKNENNTFSTDDDNKKIDTKTAKVTVQVTTWDAANNNIETQLTKEYQVSKADKKAFKVTKALGATRAAITVTDSGKLYNASNFVTNFEFKDQYGDALSTTANNAKSVKYTIELISATDKTGFSISASGLNSANVKVTKSGTYVFRITATTDDGSSKDYQFTVTAS